MSRTGRLQPCALALALLLAAAWPSPAQAQSEGGLYVAGDGFSFRQAAERGIAQNPRGRRFFVLTLPSEARALGSKATPAQRRLRERLLAANGVLLVCQRDLDNGRIDAARLEPAVVPVRGNSNDLPLGQRYFAGENPAQLPAADQALRRLRSICS